MRTPVTYYGGKQSMVKHILPLLEVPHTVYTEVYFGGGAVFFAKRPALTETINDNNNMVVNFYEVVKLHYRKLKPLIMASLVSRDHWRRATDIYKNPEGHDKIQRAWAFWFAANFSFASKPTGGLKYSNNQHFSAPSLMKRKKEDLCEAIVERIENATIENKDAAVVLRSRNVKQAMHYIDPPYPDSDQGHYSGFTMEDLVKLLDVCVTLKGKFILSTYSYPELDIYCDRHGWLQQEVIKPKLNNYKGAKQRTEMLTMNFQPNVRRMDLFDRPLVPDETMMISDNPQSLSQIEYNR